MLKSTFSSCLLIFFLTLIVDLPEAAGQAQALVPHFERAESGPALRRPAKAGAFFDVVGRRAAVFGYENQPFEVWTYPLKILKDFRLSFQIEGYSPIPVEGLDVMTAIEVRPEATILTYAHAAFTVRQILFAPLDEPGVVMLLDIDTALPLNVIATFRPDLALMWPAGLMTAGVGWDETDGAYYFVEETQRFVGVVGSPSAREVSLEPYQEEPKDLPAQMVIAVTPETAATHLVPLVVAGSVEGRAAAQTTYRKLLAEAPQLYTQTAQHYADLLANTVQVDTPDDRLDAAFTWAKIGTDKGLATNPFLGTGFLAGFRTSGNSERPGFAWFFGRDALWTAFATTAYGDLAATRTALDFLKQFQRADGKIPHEISQSAALLPWFEAYSYPWNSADATPLFVIVHNDYYQATGDRAFIEKNWDAIKAAYRFTKGTDADGNDLIENTEAGHGWIEGGVLYPGHEEIYMQGLWMEALASIAILAGVMDEPVLAGEARALRERVKAATEATYWVADEGYYAFSTRSPATAPAAGRLWEEDTVLPAVPLWWHTLDDARAQQALDHIGSGALATPWGTRILSKNSPAYDPLSYHYGSIWPLFTGWAAMGAYRYDRPHVGYQALMANVLLTYQDALGYVTELLSGDYNTAFGRSSHHQIWSEAMVATPLVRGLLGVEARDGGTALHVAPQLPADWDAVAVRQVPVAGGAFDLALARGAGQLRLTAERTLGLPGDTRLVAAPAFPRDADIQSVEVNGQPVNFVLEEAGDVQRARVTSGRSSGCRCRDSRRRRPS